MVNILLTLTIPSRNSATTFVRRGIPNHVLSVRYVDCMPIITRPTTELYKEYGFGNYQAWLSLTGATQPLRKTLQVFEAEPKPPLFKSRTCGTGSLNLYG